MPAKRLWLANQAASVSATHALLFPCFILCWDDRFAANNASNVIPAKAGIQCR